MLRRSPDWEHQVLTRWADRNDISLGTPMHVGVSLRAAAISSTDACYVVSSHACRPFLSTGTYDFALRFNRKSRSRALVLALIDFTERRSSLEGAA